MKCPKCEKQKEKASLAYCRACQRDYNRADYAKHKDAYVARAKKNGERYKREMYEWLLAYFVEHPCIGCGETDPVVLEFDHRDNVEKEDEISRLIGSKKYEAAKREIQKCDVRCANCHRRRTAQQQDWYWLRL